MRLNLGADGWVVVDVWVFGVVHEVDAARWWTWATLVVDKGVVIMLAEARKVGVADYNFSEGSGEAAALHSESARKKQCQIQIRTVSHVVVALESSPARPVAEMATSVRWVYGKYRNHIHAG